jgi:hypothetical protein
MRATLAAMRPLSAADYFAATLVVSSFLPLWIWIVVHVVLGFAICTMIFESALASFAGGFNYGSQRKRKSGDGERDERMRERSVQ